MKKISLIAMTALLFVTWSFLSGQTTVLKVKVQTANARMEPDPNSTVVKQIPMGTLLEARKKLGEWYEIVVTDEAGNTISAYIHELVVEVVGGEQRRPETPKSLIEEPRRPVSPAPEKISYGNGYGAGGFKLLGGLASANISFHSEGADTSEVNKYKKSKMGFLGGIGYESGGRIGFEINVFYLQKGVKFEGRFQDPISGDDFSFETTSSIDEVSVPVLLKLRLMPGSTPYVLGGGEVAYVASSKVKWTFKDNVSGLSDSGSEDGKEGTKDLDYGLVFGAGFELQAGPFPLFIEARYHLGLADIAGTDPDFPDVDDKDWVKTKALIVMFGIRF